MGYINEFNNFVRQIKELLKDENYVRAALLLKNGLSKQPNITAFQRFYYEVLIKLGRYEEAIVWLTKFITKINSPVEILYYNGLNYFLQNDLENSLTSLRECFERDIYYFKKFMYDIDFDILRESKEIMHLITPKKEYIVNEFISLKLIFSKTLIYICGDLFLTCQKVALNIIPNESENYNDFDNIDDIIDFHKSNAIYKGEISITPEQEFWAHCSNMQAWVESGYNTCILTRNLSFPILKELCRKGIQRFQTILKEEIIYRIKTGGVKTILFFIDNEEEYLEYLKEEDFFNGLLPFDEAEIMRNITTFFPTEYTIMTSLRDARNPRFNLRDSNKLHFCIEDGHINELEILIDDAIISWDEYLSALSTLKDLEYLKEIDIYESEDFDSDDSRYIKTLYNFNEFQNEFL